MPDAGRGQDPENRRMWIGFYRIQDTARKACEEGLCRVRNCPRVENMDRIVAIILGDGIGHSMKGRQTESAVKIREQNRLRNTR